MASDLQRSLQELLKPIVDELITITTKIETISTGEEKLANLMVLSDSLRQVSFDIERLRIVLEIEHINNHDLTREGILRAVARVRIQMYPTLSEAAESLGVDVRTLQKYADYNADNKSIEK